MGKKPPVVISSNWAQLQSKLKAGGGGGASPHQEAKKKPVGAQGGVAKPGGGGRGFKGAKGVGKTKHGGKGSAGGPHGGTGKGGKGGKGGGGRMAAAPPKSQPPKPFKPSGGSSVLMPGDAEYEACLRAAYDGFVLDSEEALPGKLRARVAAALQKMSDQDMFHYDVVSAGSRVSATFCQRTLLGDEGMTYHYQKLRIFAFPWEDKHSPEGGPLRAMRALNEAIKSRARAHLKQAARGKGAGAQHTGSCNYNITLVNYMPDHGTPGAPKVPLKHEADYNLGLASVSWHADSSLQEWSTIGVYHVTKGAPGSSDWHIALRVPGDDVTPALRVPLRSQEAYYMLNDFNHHHHHAVLAGKTCRWSSTHRVAVVERDTWEYVRGRCDEAARAIQRVGEERAPLAADDIRALGEVHVEVEFQWLRMFWIQGRKHAESHSGYWLRRMEELEAVWRQLESALARTVRALLQAVGGGGGGGTGVITARSFSMAEWVAGELREGRAAHDARCKAPIYYKLGGAYAPIDRPAFGKAPPLPRDLRSTIEELGDARAAFAC